MDRRQLLASVSIFSSLGETELDRLLQATTTKRLQPKEVLCRKGDEGNQLASEVSQEEAEGLFTYLQTQAATFHRLDASSLQRLVSFFSVLKYEKSQTLGTPATIEFASAPAIRNAKRPAFDFSLEQSSAGSRAPGLGSCSTAWSTSSCQTARRSR